MHLLFCTNYLTLLPNIVPLSDYLVDMLRIVLKYGAMNDEHPSTYPGT